jgi:serine/threonine protein kinase
MEIEKAKYASVGNYLLIQSLGSGFNSKVKLGQHVDTGKRYAVKILKDVFNKFISNEIETLNKIQHENMVNLIEFLPNVDYVKKNGTTKKVTAIVLELAPGGEVFEFLFRTGRFEEGISRYYFKSLIDCLSTIHAANFAHRDLKPENLLFGDQFQLKLADFGFSKMTTKEGHDIMMQTYLGTKGYMAPEIVARIAYKGQAVDVFAAGVILFIMFTGIPPFGEASPGDPYFKLLASKKYDYFWHAHSRNKPAGFFSAEFKDLMQAMLSADPAGRPSVDDIKGHAWYVADVPSVENVQEAMKNRYFKVQEGMQKEREEKKIMAARKKAMADGKKPGGAFMAYPQAKGARDNLSVDIFKDIETEFSNLKLERKPVVFDGTGFNKNDFLCPDNLSDSLIAVLYVLKQKNCTGIAISDKAFKISAKFTSEEGDVELIARLFKNDDLSTFVHFERKDGNTMKYLEFVSELEKELDTVTKLPTEESKKQ